MITLRNLSVLFVLTLAVSLPALGGGAADEVMVEDPWAREVPPVMSTSAGFLTLNNTGSTEHKLVAARTEAAGMVELHTHINDNGVMRMRQVENIPVAPGSSARLEPGGLHLMLMMLKAPLVAGEHITITLEFEDGSTRDVQAEVRKHHMPKSSHH